MLARRKEDNIFVLGKELAHLALLFASAIASWCLFEMELSECDTEFKLGIRKLLTRRAVKNWHGLTREVVVLNPRGHPCSEEGL